MSLTEIADRVLALRQITRDTGMITKRAQNELLSKLSDQQLAEVAVLIRSSERNECNAQPSPRKYRGPSAALLASSDPQSSKCPDKRSTAAGATQYIDADLRDTGTILDHAGQLLDFTQPVAVTLVAILHAIPDSDDPHAIAAQVMDAVPSGSYLALSHLGGVPPGGDAAANGGPLPRQHPAAVRVPQP